MIPDQPVDDCIVDDYIVDDYIIDGDIVVDDIVDNDMVDDDIVIYFQCLHYQPATFSISWLRPPLWEAVLSWRQLVLQQEVPVPQLYQRRPHEKENSDCSKTGTAKQLITVETE